MNWERRALRPERKARSSRQELTMSPAPRPAVSTMNSPKERTTRVLKVIDSFLVPEVVQLFADLGDVHAGAAVLLAHPLQQRDALGGVGALGHGLLVEVQGDAVVGLGLGQVRLHVLQLR